MPLTEHLRELRSRLVKAGIAIGIGMVVGWVYYAQLFAWLSAPFSGAVEQARSEGREVTLALTGVADPFVLQMQIAAMAGIVLASPVWLYQLWRFVTPGLHRNERRWAFAFVAVATPLFLAGVALAYAVLPLGLQVLLGFTPENVENIVSVDRYLSFFLRTVLVFGVGFLVPLMLVLLNFAGVLPGRQLLGWWRWIILGGDAVRRRRHAHRRPDQPPAARRADPAPRRHRGGHRAAERPASGPPSGRPRTTSATSTTTRPRPSTSSRARSTSRAPSTGA